MALWASGALPGLLPDAQQQAIVDEIAALQREDGGWSLSSLGSWKRRDETPVDTGSDGYATGLVTLALQEARLSRGHDAVAGGLAWLARSQDADGLVARVVSQPAARSGVGPRPIHAGRRDRLRRAGADGGRRSLTRWRTRNPNVPQDGGAPLTTSRAGSSALEGAQPGHGGSDA